jgi:oligopeptide transport system substrate-binding protein
LVRQAFALALDRAALADLVNARGDYEATVFPATTFTPPRVLGRDLHGQVGLAYNPDRARELLAQAGYPGGAGLPAITLHTNEEGPNQALAQATQAQWRDVLGVEVELAFLPWEEYIAVIFSDPPQISRLGWGPGGYLDPYSFLHDVLCIKPYDDDRYQALREAIRDAPDEEARRVLSLEMSSLLCPSWQPTLMRWDNVEYTALVTAAFNEPDPEVRRELYIQAERILCETDAVVIPLFWR